MSIATRVGMIVLLGMGACATAGDALVDASGPAVDAPAGKHDASLTSPDAPVSHPDSFVPDAFVMHDAFVPAPDASTSGALCTINENCTTTGECCLTLGAPLGICTAGTAIGAGCLPI